MKIKGLTYSLLAMILMLTSCDSSDDSDSFGPQDTAELQNTAESGDWEITLYLDDGSDETADFEGFLFTFSQDGVVTANNGTNAFTGSWSVTMDDDNDDDLYFNLFFASGFLADDLNEEWEVLEFTSGRIRLADDEDDPDDDPEFLTFERN